MSKSLPTIVVVPGAWHSPSHYAELMKHLQEAGYPTSSAPLPSLDPSAPDSVTTSHDSDFIRQTLIQPLLDANQEIILIMHSYGGSPGGVAARGLSLKERLERGEKGGIIGLVFIAAFLAHEGMSLKSAVGGTFAPWVDIDSPAPGLLTPLTPLSVFYQDVSAEIAATAIKELKPISANALSTPTKSAPAWKEEGYQGRLVYVRCGRDRCVPPEAQDGMMTGSGVEWEVFGFDEAGHSPFLSESERLAGEIGRLVGRWRGV